MVEGDITLSYLFLSSETLLLVVMDTEGCFESILFACLAFRSALVSALEFIVLMHDH